MTFLDTNFLVFALSPGTAEDQKLRGPLLRQGNRRYQFDRLGGVHVWAGDPRARDAGKRVISLPRTIYSRGWRPGGGIVQWGPGVGAGHLPIVWLRRLAFD